MLVNTLSAPMGYRPLRQSATMGTASQLDSYSPSGGVTPDCPSQQMRRYALQNGGRVASFGGGQATSDSQAKPQQDKARQAAAKLTVKMVHGKPTKPTEAELDNIAASLRKLPPKMLDTLIQNGLKIEIVDKSSMTNGDEAVYDPDVKTIKIPAQTLGKKDIDGKPTDILLHELGHAVDDLSVRDDKKGKDPITGAPRTNTKRLTDGEDYQEAIKEYYDNVYQGGSFPRPGARIGAVGVVSNGRELFAEALRKYLDEGKAGREELKTKAPKMYALIKRLVDASRG